MNRDACLQQLFFNMVDFDHHAERIQHFTKVHSYARHIGLAEGLDAETQFTLELAALTHDIGIGPATALYGTCNGKLQEEVGPGYGRTLLEALGVDAHIVERVCYLIAHHHTYANVDGLDYRILLEADFLVNLYENNTPQEGVISALDTIFVTPTGRKLCKTCFQLP